MKQSTISKIEKFLKGLKTKQDIDILYHTTIEDIDIYNAFESIYDMLDNEGAFNIDIVYYSNAIEYLKENDNSLTESLGIAEEMGYTIGKLNSETLASLLASKNALEEFNDLQAEIEEFFNEIQEDEESEEENEL